MSSNMSSNLSSNAIRTWTTAVVLALVIGGAADRIAARNHTFFADEIWVLEFVGNGRYTPHAVPQPPLYFFSAVAASRLCGMSEGCLRAPAEIAAVLLTLMPLLMWRTTRLLRPAGVIVWTAILAFSSPVSFYAARTKQYPLEALGCAVLIWLFQRAVEDRRRWKTFAIVSAFLLATMHAPVFVLAATGIAVLVIDNPKSERWKLFGMHVALAAVFGIAYFGYMRPGPEVTRYFGDLADYFTIDLPAFWDGSFSFVRAQTRLWLAQLLNLTRGFAIFFCVAGLAWLFSVIRRRDRNDAVLAIVALAPVAIVLFASAVRLYPYGEVRLMIFLLPGISLVFALATQWLIDQRKSLAIPMGAAVAVLLTMFIVQGVRDDPYNSTYMHVGNLRKAYEHLEVQRQPGTPVIIRSFTVRPLLHYVPIPDRDAIVVKPGVAEVRLPPEVTTYWTFLPESDSIRVLPAGAAVTYEMRDGWMRLARYDRRSGKSHGF
ncbi:MAG: glycosyltransferase family 39 protein [Acidobacteriota bacterium]|nr:glycosyltransferase family 39 protein [Acidobacteriota bacterium]